MIAAELRRLSEDRLPYERTRRPVFRVCPTQITVATPVVAVANPASEGKVNPTANTFSIPDAGAESRFA